MNQKMNEMVQKGFEETGGIACRTCAKMEVRHDIILFDEQLPDVFYANRYKDAAACNILLVMGTSLRVRPVSDIVDKFEGTIIAINAEDTVFFPYPWCSLYV